MPAYFDTGFSVREPMWHGEGLVLDDYPTDWADAREKAGLTWEPRAVRSYRMHGTCRYCGALIGTPHTKCGMGQLSGYATEVREDDCDDVAFVPASSKLVIRDDTGADLGHVGDGFSLVSHTNMGEILEAILGLGLKFETAGAAKGGAVVWALAYLDEPYRVAGDDTETYPFVALLNAHDGSGSCKLVMSEIRVVCWNTYQAASMAGERHGRQYVFRHTAKVMERIEEAKNALAGVRQASSEWIELAEDLAKLPVGNDELELFVQEFIPEPAADIVSEKVRSNIDVARRKFRHIYMDSVTTEGHRGSALGLVDTAVEYLDHVRGYRNRDSYLGRTLLRPEPMKAKAVNLARRVCG